MYAIVVVELRRRLKTGQRTHRDVGEASIRPGADDGAFLCKRGALLNENPHKMGIGRNPRDSRREIGCNALSCRYLRLSCSAFNCSLLVVGSVRVPAYGGVMSNTLRKTPIRYVRNTRVSALARRSDTEVRKLRRRSCAAV